MAAYARLKNEFTEDEENHNLMSWLALSFSRDPRAHDLPVFPLLSHRDEDGFCMNI